MAGQDPIPKEPNPVGTAAAAGQSLESLFSPRFKSAAAMAGWDEESILLASLIVEDTPDRDFKQRKRSDPLFKTPPSTKSRRKRRVQRRSPMPVTVLNLDEEEPSKKEGMTVNRVQRSPMPMTVLYLDEEEPSKKEVNEKKQREPKMVLKEEEKKKAEEKDEEGNKENSEASCSNAAVLPCLDKLRDELSCAICLEICYEPSTTSCGHSFCKKCLRSAADKCGKKCPKCRQLISNGRSCTVNTVLWNTIQLLFPQDVEARKAAGALNSGEATNRDIPQEKAVANNETGRPSRGVNPSRQGRQSQRLERGDFLWLSSRDGDGDGVGRQGRRGVPNEEEESSLARRVQRGEELARLLRREAARSGRRTTRGGTSVVPSQDGDAALALRLQRQEFMEAFREPDEGRQGGRSGLQSARANLRAMEAFREPDEGRQERSGGLQSARANLRAMASRAVNVRSRGGQYL